MSNLFSLHKFLKRHGCFQLTAENSRDISYVCPNGVQGRLKMAPSGRITEWVDGERFKVHKNAKSVRDSWGGEDWNSSNVVDSCMVDEYGF